MMPVLAATHLAARGRDVLVYVFMVARDRGVVVVLRMVPVMAVRATVVVPGALVMPILMVVAILVVVVISIIRVSVHCLLVGIINLPPGSLLLVAIEMAMLRRLEKLLRNVRLVLQRELAQLLRSR